VEGRKSLLDSGRKTQIAACNNLGNRNLIGPHKGGGGEGTLSRWGAPNTKRGGGIYNNGG